jgi:hypothetical protein
MVAVLRPGILVARINALEAVAVALQPVILVERIILISLNVLFMALLCS